VESYTVGTMVKAKYQGKLYVGKILDFDSENDEFLITFMKKEKGMIYRWPADNEPEDLLWMMRNKIVQVVFLDNSGKIIQNEVDSSSTSAKKSVECKRKRGQRK
jgi:hypothetical protein